MLCETRKSVSVRSDGTQTGVCVPVCVHACVRGYRKTITQVQSFIMFTRIDFGIFGSVQNSNPPLKVKCDIQKEWASGGDLCSNTAYLNTTMVIWTQIWWIDVNVIQPLETHPRSLALCVCVSCSYSLALLFWAILILYERGIESYYLLNNGECPLMHFYLVFTCLRSRHHHYHLIIEETEAHIGMVLW